MRHKHVLIALLAALVSLPSLGVGLYDDDIWQRRFLLDHLRGVRNDAWWQMFGVPSAGDSADLIYHGILPWWTSPHFQLSFFRPLAAATHYLDYWLWPQTLSLMHLQNALWYVVLCVLAAKLYRRWLGDGAVATLAALLYAIDETHLEAVAWIAARNSIMTAAFCLLSLNLLDEETRSRWTCGVAAGLALAAAHFSSEGAIAVWPYIAGWAIFCRRGEGARRPLGLALCAVVSITCLYLATRWGYTAVGSGAYIDPRVRPLEFAQAVLERLPTLLSEQFGAPAWAAHWIDASPLWRGFAVAGAAVCLAACALVFNALKGRRGLCAFLFGGLGSAIVVCAARPEPRLLLLAGLGAQALIAELLVGLWTKLRSSSGLQRNLSAFAMLWIALFHLILPLGGSVTVPEDYRQRHRARLLAASRMSIGPDDAEKIVVILTSRSYFDALSICTYRFELGARPWAAVHILGASQEAVTLTRTSETTLSLAPEHGYLLERTSQQARSPDEPFALGSSVDVDGMNITVASVTETGRPARISLQLTEDFDRELVFLTWNNSLQSFTRTSLPDVGSQIQL